MLIVTSEIPKGIDDGEAQGFDPNLDGTEQKRPEFDVPQDDSMLGKSSYRSPLGIGFSPDRIVVQRRRFKLNSPLKNR